MRFGFVIAAAFLALGAAGCASRTGDQTIAEYCAAPDHADHDICKQHADTENVRVTLGERIAGVLGVANRAQSTADQAMTREVACVTRTLNRVNIGTCDPGYTLTSCVQTRYTRRAGGLAIMRSLNDTECRFNSQVLEVQVRCCAMGPNLPPATQVISTPVPEPQTPAPSPTS